MGKEKNPRRVADNEAMAKTRMLRTSPQKLNLVATMIRGKKVEKDAKKAVDEIELPKLELESLTDRKKLEEQLKKAKSRFAELKETVGLKSAA